MCPNFCVVNYLSAENLSKSFNDKWLFKDVTVGIAQGEKFALVGENGTGKTTFVRMLAGLQKSDEQEKLEAEGMEYEASLAGAPDLNVSYKPQKIAPKFQGTTRQLLHKRIRDAYVHPQFVSDVMKPLMIENIIDNGVQNLSGGELQRLAITLALGTPADVYLIDEPSAYLDVEERLAMARTIRRVIETRKAAAFVVEHDVVAQDFIADRLMVFKGESGITGHAAAPTTLRKGMNTFLKDMNITFRRDPSTKRPKFKKKDTKIKVQQLLLLCLHTSLD